MSMHDAHNFVKTGWEGLVGAILPIIVGYNIADIERHILFVLGAISAIVGIWRGIAGIVRDHRKTEDAE